MKIVMKIVIGKAREAGRQSKSAKKSGFSLPVELV